MLIGKDILTFWSFPMDGDEFDDPTTWEPSPND